MTYTSKMLFDPWVALLKTHRATCNKGVEAIFYLSEDKMNVGAHCVDCDTNIMLDFTDEKSRKALHAASATGKILDGLSFHKFLNHLECAFSSAE